MFLHCDLESYFFSKYCLTVYKNSEENVIMRLRDPCPLAVFSGLIIQNLSVMLSTSRNSGILIDSIILLFQIEKTTQSTIRYLAILLYVLNPISWKLFLLVLNLFDVDRLLLKYKWSGKSQFLEALLTSIFAEQQPNP